MKKIYTGDKIEDLKKIDDEIKKLSKQRFDIKKEIFKETVGIFSKDLPKLGFLYFDCYDSKKGTCVKNVLLAYIVGYDCFEDIDSNEIIYTPRFCSVSKFGRPGNFLSTIFKQNMRFEEISDVKLTIEEAKKILNQKKIELKNTK